MDSWSDPSEFPDVGSNGNVDDDLQRLLGDGALPDLAQLETAQLNELSAQNPYVQHQHALLMADAPHPAFTAGEISLSRVVRGQPFGSYFKTMNQAYESYTAWQLIWKA